MMGGLLYIGLHQMEELKEQSKYWKINNSTESSLLDENNLLIFILTEFYWKMVLMLP